MKNKLLSNNKKKKKKTNFNLLNINNVMLFIKLRYLNVYEGMLRKCQKACRSLGNFVESVKYLWKPFKIHHLYLRHLRPLYIISIYIFQASIVFLVFEVGHNFKEKFSCAGVLFGRT